MLRELRHRLRIRRARRRILRCLDQDEPEDLSALRDAVTVAFVEALDADVRRAAALAESEVGRMSADPRWLRSFLHHLDDRAEPGEDGTG